jgi:hypothetical protein
MQIGQQVVCVDDQFPKPLAKYYVRLPVKDKIYTVRAVFLGRRVMYPSWGAADSEMGLLLRELVNGTDPRNKYRQELGFNIERFRALRHLDDNLEAEDELVRVRVAPKAAPLKEMALPYSPNPQPEEFQNHPISRELNPNIPKLAKSLKI